MGKTLLIVGAGLSHGSLGLPADKDFLDRTINKIQSNCFLDLALNKLYPQRGEHWKNYRLEIVWSEIFSNSENPKVILLPNEIETIYNHLRNSAAKELNKQCKGYYSFFQYEDDENKTPYEYLFKFAEWELTKLVHETYNQILAEDKKGIYRTLLDYCKGLNDDLEIISFNYDTLLEQALGNYYYEGFEFDDSNEVKGTKIIKPHGSVNWLHKINLNSQRQGGLFYRGSYSFSDFGYEKGYFCTPGIVGLIDKKQEFQDLKNPFLNIVAAMRRSVEEADRIVIIGYAFPSGDRHIRGILRDAKENRQRERRESIKKIFVVCSLEPNEIVNLKVDLNDIFYVNEEDVEIVSQRWEDWVKKLAKSFV